MNSKIKNLSVLEERKKEKLHVKKFIQLNLCLATCAFKISGQAWNVCEWMVSCWYIFFSRFSRSCLCWGVWLMFCVYVCFTMCMFYVSFFRYQKIIGLLSRQWLSEWVSGLGAVGVVVLVINCEDIGCMERMGKRRWMVVIGENFQEFKESNGCKCMWSWLSIVSSVFVMYSSKYLVKEFAVAISVWKEAREFEVIDF